MRSTLFPSNMLLKKWTSDPLSAVCNLVATLTKAIVMINSTLKAYLKREYKYCLLFMRLCLPYLLVLTIGVVIGNYDVTIYSQNKRLLRCFKISIMALSNKQMQIRCQLSYEISMPDWRLFKNHTILPAENTKLTKIKSLHQRPLF